MTSYKAGYRAGFAAFGATMAYVIVQLLQLVRVLRFPWDEILIFGASLCIVIPFVLEMLALHYTTSGEKRFWSHAALLFSVIYAVFVIANYVTQLALVIPAKRHGGYSTIRILDQTPHSLLWNFDALGYICMGLAMALAIPVFERGGFQKWVRLSFLANAAVTPLIAVVYFYPVYSEKLLILGSPWAITAPLAMLLLAILLKKKYVQR
ncbi:MAG: hypothetical protein Q8927_06420 [Bacteroidota bacterium]|nr:hypothetical protein [Bacteroidota bacterium]MDP4215817.1 hypothetical protein [Bacteroidota bacterium]MDP4247401.1 hypothetical protein [Bacteroidota bacterium]MDP4260319.1 hypothetical protein [Bacteroidota bacterium]